MICGVTLEEKANMDKTLADLYYIAEYALAVRQQLKNGNTPCVGYITCMSDLTDNIRREFDQSYQEWLDVEARR